MSCSGVSASGPGNQEECEKSSSHFYQGSFKLLALMFYVVKKKWILVIRLLDVTILGKAGALSNQGLCKPPTQEAPLIPQHSFQKA